ncbi:DNA-directed RNA polymerase subunit alpha C-terminal domain-containing protein [Eubacterium sp. 1001713B170207_170306_E7]|uniref:DNA-directed RNA polymerase subunit alpha C-terminal domain-containing protein n=1 Tax=Eubacterium sp. 1001713B170207_170306_E7 TaxID=2787097 RepID=UPI0018978B72|nr:DNA-directed RNA polymerase subunit alpha C-terminal domain-containing protein [Eubacterium sp. 1001713B170207_170306_E7]
MKCSFCGGHMLRGIKVRVDSGIWLDKQYITQFDNANDNDKLKLLGKCGKLNNQLKIKRQVTYYCEQCGHCVEINTKRPEDAELASIKMPKYIFNSLFRAQIYTLEELFAIKEDELKRIRGIGNKGSKYIQKILEYQSNRD